MQEACRVTFWGRVLPLLADYHFFSKLYTKFEVQEAQLHVESDIVYFGYSSIALNAYNVHVASALSVVPCYVQP
jgi:hypothetical protein